MKRSRILWPTLGAIAVLGMLGVLAAVSYGITVHMNATFRSAGINPQSLRPPHPVARPRG